MFPNRPSSYRSLYTTGSSPKMGKFFKLLQSHLAEERGGESVVALLLISVCLQRDSETGRNVRDVD